MSGPPDLRRTVPARLVVRTVQVALTAGQRVGRTAVAVTCKPNKGCGVPAAVLLVAAPIQGKSDRFRILAPSQVTREWTDPPDGSSVTGGLVHVVRFQPGWTSAPDGTWTLSSDATVHMSASNAPPSRPDATSGMRSTKRKKGRLDDDPYMLRGKLATSPVVTYRCVCGLLVRFTVPQPCGADCAWHGDRPDPGQPWFGAIDPGREFSWGAVTT
ncbi:MAG: hypothetical protein WCH91_14735 [bacterium]|jgi:hypothetical protein